MQSSAYGHRSLQEIHISRYKWCSARSETHHTAKGRWMMAMQRSGDMMESAHGETMAKKVEMKTKHEQWVETKWKRQNKWTQSVLSTTIWNSMAIFQLLRRMHESCPSHAMYCCCFCIYFFLFTLCVCVCVSATPEVRAAKSHSKSKPVARLLLPAEAARCSSYLSNCCGTCARTATAHLVHST